MTLHELDPNVLVGWLIFTGIVLGGLWRLSKWLNKLISIGQSIIEEMGKLAESTADHYAKDDERFRELGLQLATVTGRLDEQSAAIGRLEKKA